MRQVKLWAVLFAVVLSTGCTQTRTQQLVKAYHTAEPPNESFIEIAEASYLGEASGYALLYYDFVWGGAISTRGTQTLLVFDDRDVYLGYYYLGWNLVLDRCRVMDGVATIVFEPGGGEDEVVTLDFSAGVPERSRPGPLRFHPAH